MEGTYDPQRFYEITKGMEQMDEGGERCFACYRLRLEEAAKLAADGGFDYVTTTLSISPMKNAEKLNEIGAEVGEKYGIPWLFSDFKKRMAISVLWSCQRSMICTARAIVAAATQRHRQKERGGSDGTAKTKESKKRYFAYDLMRAAAMLLIVFYHMNCEWSARLMESSLVVTKLARKGILAGRSIVIYSCIRCCTVHFLRALQ